MNGLPEPALTLTPTFDGERPADPTASDFLAPALFVLGELSAYRKLVFHEQRGTGTSRCPLRDKMLVAAGTDPDDPESLPRPLLGTSPRGMYRTIWYAIRDCSSGHIQGLQAKAKAKGKKPTRKIALVVEGPDKTWALTEAGVAVATKLRDEFKPQENLTAAWLDGQLRYHHLRDRMLKSLECDPGLRKERASGEVGDHIDNYLYLAIKRDSFRTRLERGDPPTFRNIREWCLRSAYTTYDRRSKDALQRHTRGALTKRERKDTPKGVPACPAIDTMIVSDFHTVIQESRDDVLGESYFDKVIVDVSATDAMMHNVAWCRGMERVHEAIRRHKPGAPERYVRIFHFMAEGRSVAEIGQLENVSRNRAATLMADCRTAVRAARDAADDAETLLLYLSENYWSSAEDVEEDLSNISAYIAVVPDSLVAKCQWNGTKFSWLLGELVQRNRIETDGSGCFNITRLGHAFLVDRASNLHDGDRLIESLTL